MAKSDYERHRWRGSEYTVSVREENGQHVSEVLRREPGGKEFKPVKGSRQEAKSKAEARYLGEHRKQIVREGDALH
jgi:hypothetical protein